MIVQFKDAAKLIGLSIIACCAVLVCNLFLNFQLDIAAIEDQITDPAAIALYQAMVLSGKVVCIVSGGCLAATSLVMLCFYIGHYVDAHQKELGILKAMGYSRMKIARSFWVFGCSIFAGAVMGYLGSLALVPVFYKAQNAEQRFPDIPFSFHPLLALCLILLPAVLFSLLAVGYAYRKLHTSVLSLLHGSTDAPKTPKKRKASARSEEKELPFLKEIRKVSLQSKKSLVFFIWFAAFCFSAMIQMAAGMDGLSDRLFAMMILFIGILLACTTFFLSMSAVLKANRRTVTLMRLFGYEELHCCTAILNGYRPYAYLGFAVGTLYQYGLLKLVVLIVFKDVENMPAFGFHYGVFLITLAVFVMLYEGMMRWYGRLLRKLPFRAIMQE